MRVSYAASDSMPFSREDPPAQQYRFGYISARWSQLNGLTKDWTDKAVSYLMLTNSGGAVAVLSFMGASDRVREMVGPRFALGFFALGVVFTGHSGFKTVSPLRESVRRLQERSARVSRRPDRMGRALGVERRQSG